MSSFYNLQVIIKACSFDLVKFIVIPFYKWRNWSSKQWTDLTNFRVHKRERWDWLLGYQSHLFLYQGGITLGGDGHSSLWDCLSSNSVGVSACVLCQWTMGGWRSEFCWVTFRRVSIAIFALSVFSDHFE